MAQQLLLLLLGVVLLVASSITGWMLGWMLQPLPAADRSSATLLPAKVLLLLLPLLLLSCW
jgi:hypothetical protein